MHSDKAEAVPSAATPPGTDSTAGLGHAWYYVILLCILYAISFGYFFIEAIRLGLFPCIIRLMSYG